MGTRSTRRPTGVFEGVTRRRRRGFLATVVALDDDPVLFCGCDGDYDCGSHGTADRRHLTSV